MDAPRGTWFLELATQDMRGVIRGLRAGVPVKIGMRISNEPLIASGLAPAATRGALRLGAAKLIGGDEAISEAVAVASAADGGLENLLLVLIDLLFVISSGYCCGSESRP